MYTSSIKRYISTSCAFNRHYCIVALTQIQSSLRAAECMGRMGGEAGGVEMHSAPLEGWNAELGVATVVAEALNKASAHFCRTQMRDPLKAHSGKRRKNTTKNTRG